jgi:hypothetical protein
MLETVFAFALMVTSGTALDFQQGAPPAEETPIVAEAASAVQAQPDPTVEADEAEADISDAENYREAVKAMSKCRQNAYRQGGMAAVKSLCSSQRKRMLAAKEALKEGR